MINNDISKNTAVVPQSQREVVACPALPPSALSIHTTKGILAIYLDGRIDIPDTLDLDEAAILFFDAIVKYAPNAPACDKNLVKKVLELTRKLAAIEKSISANPIALNVKHDKKNITTTTAAQVLAAAMLGIEEK